MTSKGDVEIGKALGRKCKSIEKKRFYLKLNRTFFQTTKIKKRNVSVRKAGYQKGIITANGTAMATVFGFLAVVLFFASKDFF